MICLGETRGFAQKRSSNDQETLAQAFDKVESEEMGEGVHEKYHAWIKKLVGE